MPPYCERHQRYFEHKNSQIHTPLVCLACEQERARHIEAIARHNPVRPTFDLYPPPGTPSSPPQWEDIERLAMHYPAARHAVMLVERGHLTREQALIALVYALADAYSRMFRAEVERVSLTPSNPIVFPASERDEG